MRWTLGTLVMAFAMAAIAGCAQQEKQWMKVNQRYTTAEFRRDYAQCTAAGELDEACMRARGWVDVTPSKPETPRAPEDYRARPTRVPPPAATPTPR